MKFRNTKGLEIDGHLEIKAVDIQDEFEGQIEQWQEILIHGDPKGLKSLAAQLIYLAELEQEKVDDKYLPIGAREHIILRPKFELSISSFQTIIGRLDSKGEKKFYKSYMPKN